MNNRNLLAGLAALLVSTSSLALAADKAALPQDASISFSAPTAYPESVTWSAKLSKFLVSSVRRGTVGTVTPEGAYSPFVADERLVSTVGVLADDARDTLWVANSDPGAGERTAAATQGKLAGVATYDLVTGKAKAYYDLGALREGAHFANDIALDEAGNAYVTDSFAPLIYRIDTAGRASVFAESPLFHDADGFNLNGIAYLKSGHLLVGKYNSGEIFRVSLADPAQIEKVVLPEALKGADGFHLVDEERLVVVQSLGADRTVELISHDGWKSAAITRTARSAASMPTAATTAGDQVFVLDSRLDTLFDPKAEKVSDYTLEAF